MSQALPIYLAVEDELSEHVLRRVLEARHVDYAVRAVFSGGGFGYLKKNVNAFNNAAKSCPFLLLTDLDRVECAPMLLATWLTRPKHEQFLLRIAVREVESWLLGDIEGLSAFLGIRNRRAPRGPETLPDPKHQLLGLAWDSSSRQVREALAWRDAKTGRLFQGPDYNGTLGRFVSGAWNIGVARRACPSLERLFKALQRLEAKYRA